VIDAERLRVLGTYSAASPARTVRYARRVLLNRLVETVTSSRHVHRELARRARVAQRNPIIVVPPVMGVRLVDERRREIWGSTLRLFGGDGPTSIAAAQPVGPVHGFTLVPRLVERDVLGGLLRYIARIYGARLGEDLFALAYDWRRPLADGARALATLVARVRGASDEPVDLVGISSGGNVIRRFFAAEPEELAGLGSAASSVRRVIYMATPQRGAFSGFDYLVEGLRVVRQGCDGATMQRMVPSIFDCLPHHSERLFVDTQGQRLELDHLDPATWRELRLAGHDRPELAEELARARETQDRIARGAHPPSIVIADRHRPTATRAVIDRGKVVLPCADCAGDVERYPYAFEPGDGVVSAHSMEAAPGLATDAPWWVETSEHARVATDPHVHPLVVEALLSPLRAVPRERYLWPTNPITLGGRETAS